MYASVYRGILNILINKTSRSILIDRLKSLFAEIIKVYERLKSKYFKLLNGTNGTKCWASTHHFSKIKFAARLVGLHDNIKTKGKKPMSNLQWPLFYSKTPLHNCVRRKERSRWLERVGYCEDAKEMYPDGLKQLVGNYLLIIFKQNYQG